jgi:hypothetical protein
MPKQVERDFSAQFNTPLSAEEQQAFMDWVAAQSALAKRDVTKDLFNYDLQGYWKDVGQHEGPTGGHLTDTYKKPNHPTFSQESRYHGATLPTGDVAVGGTWKDKSFLPGPTNINFWPYYALREYFRQVEPETQLQYPKSQR